MISLKESILSGRQQSIDNSAKMAIPSLVSDIISKELIEVAKGYSTYKHGGTYVEMLFDFNKEREVKEIIHKLVIRLSSVLPNTVLKYIDDQILVVDDKLESLPVNVTQYYNVSKDTCAIFYPALRARNSFITVLLSNEIAEVQDLR